MLKLRRGTVVSEDPLTVDVAGVRRPAWCDADLVGPVRRGDEVIVNVEALDLELGSGGFDVVYANLTRGLDGDGAADEHVMKLNYSPLQHAVEPLEPELPAGRSPVSVRPTRAMPVAVCLLHGQLPAVAFGARARSRGLRVGYVQGAGGALPGRLSRVVGELRRNGLLAGHVTAGASYGGEQEAITLAGALAAAADELEWDAADVCPGPGILGSASGLGHGGMAALDGLHAARALGLDAVLCPRVSIADPRERHRGLSHHTRAVLELCLDAVDVAVPAGEAALVAAVAEAGDGHHRVCELEVDLRGYEHSGLPTRTMGRGIEDEPGFFAAALAAGTRLAELAIPA